MLIPHQPLDVVVHLLCDLLTSTGPEVNLPIDDRPDYERPISLEPEPHVTLPMTAQEHRVASCILAEIKELGEPAAYDCAVGPAQEGAHVDVGFIPIPHSFMGDKQHEVAQARDGACIEMEPLLVKDRKSTRLNSSHMSISYAVFCLKKKT